MTKYSQVMNVLINDMSSGKLKPNDKIPSDAELMKKFSVSKIVVTNALNRLANDCKIKRIPGKGTFVTANDIKDSEKLIDSKGNSENEYTNIALIVPDIIEKYSIELVRSIVNYGYEKKMCCSIFYSKFNITIEENLIRNILSSGYKGVILFPSTQEVYNKELMSMLTSDFPIVLVDRDLSGLEISCVQTDNYIATEQAIAYLMNLGHKKIAIYSSEPTSTSSVSRRLDGYISEMRKNNILIDPSLIFMNQSNEENDERLNYIVENRIATAFLCINTGDFKIIKETIEKKHMKIPDDFSIVTFDSIYLFEWSGSNPTFILQNTNEIAETAITLLSDKIENKSSSCKKIFVNPTLIQGYSTKELGE